LRGLSVADKNEWLFQLGINFNDLPAWQKRGVGLFWQLEERTAIDRLTNTPATVQRRRLDRQFDLPIRDAYATFIAQFLGA